MRWWMPAAQQKPEVPAAGLRDIAGIVSGAGTHRQEKEGVCMKETTPMCPLTSSGRRWEGPVAPAWVGCRPFTHVSALSSRRAFSHAGATTLPKGHKEG